MAESEISFADDFQLGWWFVGFQEMFQRVILILLFPVVLAVGLLFGSGGLLESGILPPCLINGWTGLHCPGCGGTRAFQSLAQADLMGAVRMNPLGVIFILWVALFLLRTSWEAAFPGKAWPRLNLSDRWWWGVLVVVGLFTLLRNLPWWPLTLLAPH